MIIIPDMLGSIVPCYHQPTGVLNTAQMSQVQWYSRLKARCREMSIADLNNSAVFRGTVAAGFAAGSCPPISPHCVLIGYLNLLLECVVDLDQLLFVPVKEILSRNQ